MSLFSHILLVATSEEGPVSTWDVRTGTHVATFKANASPSNGLALLGHDYFIASQTQKDSLHFYTWHKEALVQRCFTPEAICSVTASPGGGLVFAGGSSGMLYAWNVSSGRLLCSLKAHNKALSCIKCSDNGTQLYTGGLDAVLACWLLPLLLDAASSSSNAAAVLQPRWSGVKHTLGITAISVGAGACSPRVLSCSKDSSCRLWCGATGACLRCILLPSPPSCCAVTPCESSAFVGCGDGGVAAFPLAAAEAAESSPLELLASSHTKAVSCLAMSTDGVTLASGSLDGSVLLWDTATKQTLKSLKLPTKYPVSNLLMTLRPPYLRIAGAHSGDSDTSGRHAARPARISPLGHFNKFAGPSATLQPLEDGVAILDRVADEDIVVASGLLEACQEMAGGAGSGGGLGGGLHDGTGSGAAEELMTVKLELQQLKTEISGWKRNYAELYHSACDALDA